MMKIIVCILLLAPMPLLSQDVFFKKYAGAYTVMVNNDGSEAFSLSADGSAVWISGWQNTTGKPQTQKKYGNWIAKEGYMKITINGNTGKIIQEYKMKNGRFVNVNDSKIYLLKT